MNFLRFFAIVSCVIIIGCNSAEKKESATIQISPETEYSVLQKQFESGTLPAEKVSRYEELAFVHGPWTQAKAKQLELLEKEMAEKGQIINTSDKEKYYVLIQQKNKASQPNSQPNNTGGNQPNNKKPNPIVQPGNNNQPNNKKPNPIVQPSNNNNQPTNNNGGNTAAQGLQYFSNLGLSNVTLFGNEVSVKISKAHDRLINFFIDQNKFVYFQFGQDKKNYYLVFNGANGFYGYDFSNGYRTKIIFPSDDIMKTRLSSFAYNVLIYSKNKEAQATKGNPAQHLMIQGEPGYESFALVAHRCSFDIKVQKTQCFSIMDLNNQSNVIQVGPGNSGNFLPLKDMMLDLSNDFASLKKVVVANNIH